MQFLTSLIGGAENTYLTAAVALGLVLVLIVLGLWVLKVFFRASNRIALGRTRRLKIVEQVAIDQKRRLLIVRRDNVEHVILTGGPQDVVVETAVPVERPAVPAVAPLPAHTVPSASDVLSSSSGADVPTPEIRSVRARAGAAAINRLRRISEEIAERRPSLRQTGLLRPVSRMAPAAVIPMSPDNSEHRRTDSAKTVVAGQGNGQAEFGGDGHREEGIGAERT